MTIGSGFESEYIGWFSILIASIFIRDYYLEYNKFLSLSDKVLVIVNPTIPIYTFRKKRERDQNSFSLHKNPLLISLLTVPELAKWLK